MKKLLLVGLVLVSTLGYSQVEQGDINVSASLTYTNLDGTGVGLFFAKAGYYYTQNIEFGSSLQFIFAQGANGIGIGPYATYNFLTDNAKLLPYVGAQVSILSIGDLDVGAGGVYGGAKYFITEAINIDAGLSLQAGFGDIDGGIFTATIGLGFVLGKLR